jgi:GNAT superfamily N-acetyltransferase
LHFLEEAEYSYRKVNSSFWSFMRRKVIAVTAKTLEQSGLECASCLRWEGIQCANNTEKQTVKAEYMRKIIKEQKEFGKIVCVGGQTLAYSQYAPAEYWPGIIGLKAGAVSDDAVLITCLTVQPLARGRGLGRVLLQAIESGLVKRRVKAIEVFVTRGGDYPPGPIEFYLQNGFYILRDDPKYPLLRLELKTLVGWQINTQFALDRLRIPQRAVVAPPA